jgi:hypothetical protein
MAGSAVMIKDRSNKFWDMDISSVPGTPSQPTLLGDTLQAASWASHPGTVEEFPEDEHEAAEGTHSQKVGVDLAGADGPVRMAEEQEVDIPINDWNAPMTADGAGVGTSSRPATESEDVRPDTAAPDAMIVGLEEMDLPEGQMTENEAQDAGFEPAPTEADLAVMPVTEFLEAGVEVDPAQLDEPIDVIMLSEEANHTEESHEAVGAEQEEAEAEAALTEEDPAPAEEPSETAKAAATDATVDAAEDQVQGQREDEEAEAAATDATVDAAEDQVQGHREDEDAEGEEEFVPEIKRPGEEAISYLAGESFRVTHVGDMDSVGAASDVLESSLGGESGVLDEDWAREHPAGEAADAPIDESTVSAPLANTIEEAALLPEESLDAVTEPAQPAQAESDAFVEDASLEELPPGPSVDTASLVGLPEESVLSAENPVAEAAEVPVVVRKTSRQGVTFAEEPQEAPVNIPAEHSELASGAGEGDDELVDFSALDGEMND